MNEQQSTTKQRRRTRKVDVHQLRRQLLQTASRYLEETPLGELNAAMVKAIGEVCGSVGEAYEKHERTWSPSQALAGWNAPFPVPCTEEPPGVLPPPGTASPANGFPSVPEPSVKGDSGGIKTMPPTDSKNSH